jgi:hypothetical protein
MSQENEEFARPSVSTSSVPLHPSVDCVGIVQGSRLVSTVSRKEAFSALARFSSRSTRSASSPSTAHWPQYGLM